MKTVEWQILDELKAIRAALDNQTQIMRQRHHTTKPAAEKAPPSPQPPDEEARKNQIEAEIVRKVRALEERAEKAEAEITRLTEQLAEARERGTDLADWIDADLRISGRDSFVPLALERWRSLDAIQEGEGE